MFDKKLPPIVIVSKNMGYAYTSYYFHVDEIFIFIETEDTDTDGKFQENNDTN
jgi:hypothetical protein